MPPVPQCPLPSQPLQAPAGRRLNHSKLFGGLDSGVWLKAGGCYAVTSCEDVGTLALARSALL